MRQIESFGGYLEAWDNYIKANNLDDWADDEDDQEKSYLREPLAEVNDEFIVVKSKKTKTKKTNYKKTKDTREQGTLLKWIPKKNFGFIICAKFPKTEIFCHGSALIGLPIIGGKVLVKIGRNEKGFIATSAEHKEM